MTKLFLYSAAARRKSSRLDARASLVTSTMHNVTARPCASSPTPYVTTDYTIRLFTPPEITSGWSSLLADRILLLVDELSLSTAQLAAPTDTLASGVGGGGEQPVFRRARTFRCGICGAIFARGAGLEEHMVSP